VWLPLASALLNIPTKLNISLIFFPVDHIGLLVLSYRCVWHAIVVGVIIAHVANAVMVGVFLSWIGYPHTIILCPEINKTRSISYSLIILVEQLYSTNLFTSRVIACQIDVRPSIQIQVWSAYFAVSSPTHDTLKYRTTMSTYTCYFVTIILLHYCSIILFTTTTVYK